MLAGEVVWLEYIGEATESDGNRPAEETIDIQSERSKRRRDNQGIQRLKDRSTVKGDSSKWCGGNELSIDG